MFKYFKAGANASKFFIKIHPNNFDEIFYHPKGTTSIILVLLNKLVDSDDEKPTRGRTRDWVKRRKEKGYFNNIIKELKIEDRIGFREMFRMDISDFESILAQIGDKINPKERLGGTEPIQSDERLALTLLFLATYCFVFIFQIFELLNVKKFERHSILTL